ncbi:MAG TPA: hypothetical protein PKC76_01765 [Saprospiraceae bacterium]|nr:hypothetical protein [Saprospiraceae bacterium]HMP22823.1 hypothetical protein [Saprospiraceae bacterium]
MKLTNLLWLSVVVLAVGLSSCKKDDTPPEFNAPTIAVTFDNSEPFPGDMVTFRITATAPGGLARVELNGMTIKSYTAGETSDQFDYEFTVPAGATLGPTTYTFTVTDAQTNVKNGSFEANLTIQNPDFRGSPVMLADFNSSIPNSQVQSITFDSGPNSWEAAYALTLDFTDPMNVANRVLRANRLGACEWFFQGFGAVFTTFTQFLSEDDMAGLADGSRVLQMNVLMQENPKVIAVHTNPNDVDGTRVQRDVSYTFKLAERAWNYDAQDSVQAIPLRIEIGNASAWSWNNGNPLGKKMFLTGSLTKPNAWETVTFSALRENTQGDFVPLRAGASQSAYLDDPNIGLDQINYMALIVNAGFSAGIPIDGVFEIPGDGNGWRADVTVRIRDDHNSYLIDNIRVIDAADYDKNPN